MNNGYNQYFISHSYEADILHTLYSVIVLLEYKILKKSEDFVNINSKQLIKKEQKNNKKIKKEQKNNKKIKNNENKSKDIVESFDNILTDKNKYFIDINYYNTSAILLIILICFLYFKLKVIYI